MTSNSQRATGNSNPNPRYPALDAPLRGRIYDSITDTIGNTPLVRLQRLPQEMGCVGEVIVKCEFFNPLSSVKDRIAYGMIDAAERAGKIKSDTLIVEPTSGNTGIGLALICAARGYKLLLTMPESMSYERRKMLKLLGAQLELTPASEGMRGAITRAETIASENKNAFMLQQFQNPANPEIHEHTTAEELLFDTGGKFDVFVTGVGTGGTLTGTARTLKRKAPHVKIVAVEPDGSPVLSGGAPGSHKIQGIGAGFIPEILERELIDDIETVSNDDAFTTARALASKEGLAVGISSGATIAVALRIAKRPEMKGKRIVVIAASGAERYLSTSLFPEEP